MKLPGKADNGPVNKCLNFGGDPSRDSDVDPDSDPYRDIGETCLGGGMRYPSASSFLLIHA